jgi:hypothetical protein
MNLLRASDNTTQHNKSSNAFNICLIAADRITELLEKTKKVNPRFECINTFVNYCIYQSAFVYLIKAKIDLHSPPQANHKPRSVAIHIECLESLAQTTKVNEGLKNLLIKLAQSVQDTWEVEDDRYFFFLIFYYQQSMY